MFVDIFRGGNVGIPKRFDRISWNDTFFYHIIKVFMVDWEI